MSFSTHEDLSAMWAYLEELDPSVDYRGNGPYIKLHQLDRLYEALAAWEPNVSEHHHAIALTVLAHLKDWGKRQRTERHVFAHLVRHSLRIYKSKWSPQEHGFGCQAVVREAFCVLRDYGRKELAAAAALKNLMDSTQEE